MHFYAWRKGLKTGMYYLRARPKADAKQFTVDQAALAQTSENAAKENTANVGKPTATSGQGARKMASDSMDVGVVKDRKRERGGM